MAGADFTRIATNISALNSLNALQKVNTKLGVSQLRLATGKRINAASDDAAGLNIATKFDMKAKGLGQVLANINDAKSLISVAEGHLSNVSDILTKMKVKAQQAANDTLGAEERKAILEELKSYNDQIDAEVAQAQWGGPLLSDRDIYFQISVSSAAEDTLRFNLAEAVFGVAAGKTFNSDDLGVRVSDSADAVVADTAVQYKAGTIGDPTLAVSDPADINSVLGELEQGHYTLEISTTGDGTNAAITARLRDAQGQLVTISATGEAGGGGDIGTVMNATSTGATAALHLGSGVTIDLTGLDVTNGQAATVTVGFDYVRGGSTLDDNSAARAFMDKVDVAAEKVAGAMSYIGSVVNRLEYQESSLSVAKVNTEAAYNRIMNADMAFEQIEATKYMILQQTSVAMLAQANMSPQAIMGLFR
ncbi:MAG TPA: hypothetical protein GX702_12110 [Chloroflexi bacterium]|jgi:flagellin|nr:hypothetical protein [Chloroflexota bacterium]